MAAEERSGRWEAIWLGLAIVSTGFTDGLNVGWWRKSEESQMMLRFWIEPFIDGGAI